MRCAGELLEVSGDGDDRRRRHLEHYGDFARELYAGQDEAGIVPFADLRRDLDNVRVALDWAVQAPGGVETGLWLAADMYDVWTGAALDAEGVARLDALLRTGRGSPVARSRAARNAAILAAHMGHGDEALTRAEQALDEAGRGARSAEERRARQVLAELLLARGDAAAARRCLAPALPIVSEQTTDVDAFCLITHCGLDRVVGALDEAEATARHVLSGTFGSLPWLGPAARYLPQRDHAGTRRGCTRSVVAQ